MKLTIATHQANEITVSLDQNSFTQQLANPREADLLAFINTILEQKQKTLQDITEIEVHSGPGPFTSLRTGIAVAQSLSLSLNLPINDLPAGSTIEIVYGKAPNITTPKV